ncbi:MAG: endonuclease III [Candidatus Cloacimonetes bacterium]|nr:endonuclease III [Candidatus Cloacimonadota bacterium]
MFPIDKVIIKISEFTKNLQTPIMDLVKIQTNDPFKILVGTILSARTKDQTTAKVLKNLFTKVNKVNDFLLLNTKEIENLIYPIGFYRQKAIYLQNLPIVLNQKFNGEIPQTIEELIQLPGVGRKTANLVMILAFDKPAMCVDVHVHRISNRLGYINTKSPAESEIVLRKALPIKYWKIYNSILVAFGQHQCKPVNPKCKSCPVENMCKKVSIKTLNKGNKRD